MGQQCTACICKTGRFKKLKSGEKTLELRVYDDKRRQLKVGDTIVFKHMDDSAATLTAQITGLLIYGCFADLLNDVPMNWLAYTERERDDLIARMATFYSAEEQTRFGVVGIRIKCL